MKNFLVALAMALLAPLGAVANEWRLTVGPGWNLVGNGINASIDVADFFGDGPSSTPGISARIASVWKWDAAAGRWAFFSPRLGVTALEAFCAAKGYLPLKAIAPGEGFWINATSVIEFPIREGALVTLKRNQLRTGWNLLASGRMLTPSQLNNDLAATPAVGTQVPNSFTSLWTWDNGTGKWLFYAPELEARGLRENQLYAQSMGFLDFTRLGRVLGREVGFWVHSPVAGVSNWTPPVGLSVSRNSLVIEAEEGQPVPFQYVTGWVTGATAPVNVTIAHTNRGLEYVDYEQTGTTSGRAVMILRRASDLAAGTYTDTVTVNACYDTACTRPLVGSPKRIGVTYVVRPRSTAPKLLVSDNGVAFAAVPSGARLTHAVKVRTAGGDWSAMADVSWLTVTAAGPNGGELMLAADPAGLAEGFHEARVTVTATGMTRTETIRVGMYVSGRPAASAFANAIGGLDWAVDPVRPLVYSVSGNVVRANHVYTGEEVAAVSVPGAILGNMAVSTDGSRLFVVDGANRAVVAIDLDKRTVVRSYGFPQFRGYSYAASFPFVRLAFARVNGTAVLLMNMVDANVNDGSRTFSPIIEADSGAVIGELYGYFGLNPIFAASRDGSSLYATDVGLSGALRLTRMALRENSLGNVYGVPTHEQPLYVSSVKDIATTPEGGKAFVCSYTDNEGIQSFTFDGTNFVTAPRLTPPRSAPYGVDPCNIEVTSTGRVVTQFGTTGLRAYDLTQPQGPQWVDVPQMAGTAESGMLRVSSDGLRVLGRGFMMNLPQ